MPLLTPARALAVGTLLGPLEERKVNWYLEHPYVEVLLVQLSPHLDKIAQVVLHYAVSVCISLKYFVYLCCLISVGFSFLRMGNLSHWLMRFTQSICYMSSFLCLGDYLGLISWN